jgi:hypothetical protein
MLREFPYANLEEEVYMSPPHAQVAELPHGYCLKLKKSLYGLASSSELAQDGTGNSPKDGLPAVEA